MALISGVSMIVVAALFQGTFLVPMTRMRNWQWEHAWVVFALLAMIVFNWALSLALLPNPVAVYQSTPRAELLVLALFGAGWGGGAVLFGLGMDKLGLTLGYPVIMGLNATVGTLVPLVTLPGNRLLSGRSLWVLVGTAIAIAGIVICSIAGSRKQASSAASAPIPRRAFTVGLMIAVAAGLLSALPNVGMNYGAKTIAAATSLGSPDALAGNAVWAVFFTLGGIVNLIYCAALMIRRGNLLALVAPGSLHNLALGAAMAAMWIGSFYLYGIGASRLGAWGAVIGWPVFVALSIGVGILWGLRSGEWRNAPASSRRMLNGGLLLILLAVAALALSNRF
jgi:L-rhamnose-H+ transport protein